MGEEEFYVKAPEWRKFELTITKLLEYGSRRFPTAEIVPYPPRAGIERYTLKDVYERVLRLANALEEMGVEQGTRVGVVDHTSVPFLEAGYAVPCMGAVLHPINIRLSEADLKFVINNAEDEVLLTYEEFVPRLEKAKKEGELKKIKHFLISTSDGKPINTKLEPASFYDESLKSASPSYDFPDLKEDTPAIILYTTGTTGTPKGCWFMHRDITLKTILSSIGRAPAGPEQATLNVVPFYHIMGWGAPYNFLLTGGKLCWAAPPRPEYMLLLIKREKITVWWGVPTLVAQMLSHQDFEKHDLSSLQGLTMGGAATPEGLKKEIEKKFPSGVRAFAGRTVGVIGTGHLDDVAAYGLTETWSGFGLWAEYKVLDKNLQEVSKPGETGELCAMGTNFTPGYIKDFEKSKELWAGGYLHTGDLVTIADDGSYVLTDREKDMIKSGGEFIATLRMESLLSTHPNVGQLAIVGAYSVRWGERPVAVVVPNTKLEKEEEEKLRKELEDILIEHEAEIPKWWRPDKYIFRMEPLPLTSVEKIDKKAVREEYKDILKKEDV